MLKRADAVVQITRLAQYGRNYAETKPEGIDELIKAISLACYDKRQAERVIDTWTRENRWMPTVADLYTTATRVEERPTPPAKHGCELCDFTGWARTWVLSTVRGGSKYPETVEIDESIYDQLRLTVDGISQCVGEARKGCDCEYGKFLANERWKQKEKELSEMEGKRR